MSRPPRLIKPEGIALYRDSAHRPQKPNEVRKENASEGERRVANVKASLRELAALIAHHPERFNPPASASLIASQILKLQAGE